MFRLSLIGLLLGSAQTASACATALLLAMDVSHSVDGAEYRIQTEGVAQALSDPAISEILVQEQVSLAVVQWSGLERQELSIDWQTMTSGERVSAFAAQVSAMPRAFFYSDTAPAEALAFSLNVMENAPYCQRRVIDVSGDGTPNAGSELAVGTLRRQAEHLGVTINGLAIEGMGVAITNYYQRHLVTGDGFVITARGFTDFSDAMQMKILREISRVIG